MATNVIAMDIKRRRTMTVVRDVKNLTEEGYDVVLSLGESPSPERVLKILKVTARPYGKIMLTIRHAELKEYIEHAIAGAAAGVFFVGAAKVLAALAVGDPVSLVMVLKATGLGAAIGAIFGLCSTPLAEVKVYKFRGDTRIKYLCKAA